MTERLQPQPGEWIDRNQPVDFRFEGKSYSGFAGDVLASALWANGVRMTGRSFKYHRPRSVYSLANHDANFLVEDGQRTNLRGDVLPITSGLDVRTVNTWGSLASDRLNFTERFAKFLPVGFYYKGFHTPRRLFPFYENRMRQVAGLGKLDPKWKSQSTPKDYDFCELLVIGAGPAGLSAAISAANQGADVLVVDEMTRAGGSLTWQWAGDPIYQRLVQLLVSQAERHDRIRFRLSTQAAGWYSDHWVALVDQQRLTKLRAKALVVASGCCEQPAVFQNNDLPGVLLGSAAQRLVHQYAVKPFSSAVVVSANPDGYRAALDLLDAGVEVAAVVDLLSEPPGELGDQVSKRGVEIYGGFGIYQAISARSKKGVAGVTVAPLDRDGGLDLSRDKTILCDGVAVSVGWAPMADLLYQSGARFGYDDNLQQLVPTSIPDGVFAAGRVRGIYDLHDQQQDGTAAGAKAASYLGYEGDRAESEISAGPARSHPYPIFSHPGKKNFVDFDEDLHLTDFVNAHQEGYDNVELLKRYSTVGMGPSQGKLSNQNAVRILARLNGKTIDQTGTTTSRPFHHPVSIEHLAGRRFHPLRRTPMHSWHADNGASFFHVGGGWLRPEYYSQGAKSVTDCILEEAQNVRGGVGLIDLGTLGKIHVSGPDAVQLLNRVYTGSFTKQKIGSLRYGVACDESGIIIEDGIVARWSDDHFYISATSSGSASFFRELQRWALLWQLDVVLINLTGQYTAMNIAGPGSREVLAQLCDTDLSSAMFPFSGARLTDVAGIKAMVMRVGFIGELGYELHVPASRGLDVWRELLRAGESYGIRPFGVEAQRLLRLEKGHIIVSQDTDALTTPFHVNLDGYIYRKKKFFVGKRSLEIMEKQSLDRSLVGFQFAADFQGPLPNECNLVIDQNEIVGRVTSIAHRSTLQKPLGLAFVRPDLAAIGTKLAMRTDSGTSANCQVTETPFYDPQNERQAV